MIYSASRRSDMVAFFPDEIVSKSSRSRKLEAIVFWTKDIRNLVLHDGLRRAAQHWPSVIQFTATGLAGSSWEPKVPPLEAQAGALRELARMLPYGSVRWRFDPVIPGPGLQDRFRRVREILTGACGDIDAVTVSFPDPYGKAVRRACDCGLAWPEPTRAERSDILGFMVGEFGWATGSGAPPPVRLCCEPELLALPGVGRAACVDAALFDRLHGTAFGDLGKDPGQRRDCGCMKSADIGSYDMACPHACRYCYANPG